MFVFSSGMTKLLVGLGVTDLDSVEVVNLEGQYCQDLPNYPIKVAGSTGQLLNGSVPMICGGVTEGVRFINRCRCYALVDQKWVEVSQIFRTIFYMSDYIKLSFCF